MKSNTTLWLSLAIPFGCQSDAAVFLTHRSREAKIAQLVCPTQCMSALLAQSRQKCIEAGIAQYSREFQCPKVRLLHSKEVHLLVRHVCMIFLSPKPCTCLGRYTPNKVLHCSFVKVQRVGMSAEAKYSDRWINIWKDGLDPGQASSIIITPFSTSFAPCMLLLITAMSGLHCRPLMDPEQLPA